MSGMNEKTSKKIQVKCNVDNCGYNKGHTCYADNIEVDTSGDNKAYTSSGTCCSTFENKAQ